MKTIVLILCLSVSAFTYAANSGKAKVIMVRGKATKLLPGAKNATPVQKGELLPEDTSVVTADKSIVRLSFEDKSSVNIGPNSKLVVSKMEKKKANMLNLLTGAIKSEVDKREKKEDTTNKMIIKTRSAVMGVRGTKFQTIYNPANKNTSLVTIEGKVAMVKRTETPPKVVEKVVEAPVESTTTDAATEAATKTVEKVAVAKTPDEELLELDKALDEPTKAIEVTEGKYSGVGDNVAKPTEPVKIAPKQYDALAKSMNSTKTAQDVMQVSETEALAEVAKDAPRPGGFIDFQTGIYVEPPKDSAVDTTTGTYKSEEIIGSVDEVTGDYVPPKGVELDAKKGFVIKEEEMEKVASADKEKLQETIAKLNDDVKKQVVVNKMEDSTENKSAWYKPKNHLIGATFIPYSEYLSILNKETNSEAEFYSSSAKKVFITWGQNWSWSENITTMISFGGNDLQWEKPSDAGLYTNGENGGYFSFGADYKWSEKLVLNASLIDETVFYIVPNRFGGSSVNSFKTDMSRIDLSFDYFLYDWKMFRVNLNAGLKMYMNTKMSDDYGSADADASGFYVGMNGILEWSESLKLDVGGWIDRTTLDVKGLSFTKYQFGTSANIIWTL